METEDLAPQEVIVPDTSSSPRDPHPITTESGRRSLMRNNPAVSKEGWAVVPGVSPDLDRAADLHNEAVRGLAAARQAAMELGKKYRAEDEQRTKAYETGLEVPRMTDPAERNAAVTEARSRVEAAENQLTKAAVSVVGLVQDNEDAWLADLAEKKAAAEEKIEAAQRLVNEAHSMMGAVGRNEVWIRRTADNLPGRHISVDLLGVKLPPEPVDLATLAGTTL